MEEKGLLRGGGLLLLLALARTLVTGFGEPTVVLGPGEDQLPELMAEAEKVRAAEERSSTPLEDGEKLDPNRAEAVELTRLPGIGPSTAEAWIRYRETRGGFQDPDDLLQVSGIGPATLERIRPHLDFSGGVPLALRKMGRRPSERLDLNRANQEELETLPGIGPALARRILESRAREGPFLSPEDLIRVPGIGPATLQRIQSLVRVGI